MDGASPYLRQLETFVPAVFSNCRGESGSRTLGSLSDGLAGYVPPPTVQGWDDLTALAAEKAGALLGADAARALVMSLEESFTALTANHHAINTLPDFTQGTLVYALRLFAEGGGHGGKALPVFAAGGVPMSDFTYPPGVLLGRPRNLNSTAGERFRLFKPLARKTLVNWQPAFCAEDVAKAGSRLTTGDWLWFEQTALAAILSDILAGPEVLGQRLYSHQCTVINAKLWPRFFKPEVPIPRLIMLDKLELERDLLIADMRNEDSLAYAILFDTDLRYLVARSLNGDRGCWTCESLDDRSPLVRGTLFFWGIDREGRMFPLNLDQEKNCLFSTLHTSFRTELTPGAIACALSENSILPGLYMGFTAMALARGLLCCGGVFQTGYLRRMRKGTAACLAATGFKDMAACLEALPDAPLTSGFLPIGFNNGINPPYAAGGVEMFASGGLSAENLETLRSLTVSQALDSSFDYIYELVMPSGERMPGWREALRRGYGLELFPAARPTSSPRLASAPGAG
ncbi:MAG: hypothetical protein LBU06_03100 [Desulfovibrio sp.]|nr:hypothetical protein [Desulfovibrio sp.]